MRDNPHGVHRELWYHVAGCHSWLVVTRDTMSHEITRVEFARDAASERSLTGGGG
jgi:sarcosine oxidase subunit delta